MKLKSITLAIVVSFATQPVWAQIETPVGDANIDLRLRYENVTQDNALKDATALTLRTKANFKTHSYNGFYGFFELENNLALVDEYNNTLGDGTEYSVIADPNSTELDQAYIGYKRDKLNVKVGRQVIVVGNHRQVGHVGWRQDKQTFDAVTTQYKVNGKLDVSYAYISKRNRIFADQKDIEANDHIVNINYQLTSGKVSAYSVLLEEDKDATNGIDTFGARFDGLSEKLNYTLEFATQSQESETDTYQTNYLLVEGSTKLKGLTFTGGFESLGSDEGQKGFATPLATLHKFNGWADQFLATPAQGLNDLYASLSGKLKKGKWALTFHSYTAAESTSQVDDLGSEINLLLTQKINGKYPVGLKFAAYSAGDIKTDTNKLWLWTSYSF